MKNYSKEITGVVLFAVILSGLILWFARYDSGAYLKIIIAVLVSIGAYIFVRQIITKKRNLTDGVLPEDEFTKSANLYAGSKAFHYSMYLWLFVFIFNSSFTSQEEMLGVGIMGSALIYGIFLWYYKKTGDFNEE
jgi:hypothetical protein